MKLLIKSLIATFVASLFIQSLNAKTTICYKNSWQTPSSIETTKLDGGECKGEFSFKEMTKKGWILKDINITNAKKGLNYSYTFTNEKLVNMKKTTSINSNYKKLNFKPIRAKLQNVKEDEAIINIPNLRIGQSAVIQHHYTNSQNLLIANAHVISSNDKSSTLKLTPFLDLKQNALPTSNRKAKNGDIAIVNYLYDTSLIIAPTQNAFFATRAKYRDNNFLHSDLFASQLKIKKEPLPSKQTIQNFAIAQNIGTLFFIIDNYVYIVDTKTFAILEKESISYNLAEDKIMPFYTRVEKIEANAFTSIFGKLFSFSNSLLKDEKKSEEEQLLEDKIKADDLSMDNEIYNNYYKTLLGIK